VDARDERGRSGECRDGRAGRDVTVHPNFFLVGAPRAGTTSLWQYLKAHPEVYMPATLEGKEPSHFCDLTAPWARRCRDYETYLTLFEKGHRALAVGDASTNYLIAPEAAGRIQRQYPDAKILIILRNPADRAYSVYSFLCYWGIETATTFEAALRREDARAEDAAFRSEHELLYYAFLYYRSSLYSQQIKRYLDLFPRDKVHIVLNDDLKQRGMEVVQGIYRFLGVNPDFEPELDVHNKSQLPMSITLQNRIASRWHAHPLRPRTPIRRRDKLHYPVAIGINTLLGNYRKAKMRPETRRALIERFRPDIEATSVLIGRDLGAWSAARPGPARAQAPEVAQAG
jgi:hypothetical protein